MLKSNLHASRRKEEGPQAGHICTRLAPIFGVGQRAEWQVYCRIDLDTCSLIGIRAMGEISRKASYRDGKMQQSQEGCSTSLEGAWCMSGPDPPGSS